MSPEALQAQTLGLESVAPTPKKRGLRSVTVTSIGMWPRVQRVGLADRDAVEDTQVNQPVARVVDILGRVLLSSLEARHVGGESGSIASVPSRSSGQSRRPARPPR